MTLYSLAGKPSDQMVRGNVFLRVMTDMTGKGRDDLLLLQASSGISPGRRAVER